MSAFDLGLLNTSYNAADALSVAYPSDSYNFTLGNTQSLKLSLTGISAAVDWQLKDNEGTNLHSGSISPANVGAINLDNLPAGGYSLELSQTSDDTNYALNIDPLTKLNVESGFFTVGQTGQVGVDYLIDGGAYQGELAIFSLAGMEAFAPGSELFIKEVARRSLSNSLEGYVTIQDATESAKFSPTFPWGDNENSGEYKNIKTFTMKPGDKFGFMLVPNGTVQEVFDNPNMGGAKRPLFSLVTANPNEAFHVGQIADVIGDGKTFVMEDKRVDAGSDKDYNDLVFRVTGATGKAVKLDDVIAPDKDWRSQKIGDDLRDYINTAPKSLQFTTKSVYKAGETVNLTDAKVYDENGDLSKIDFWLKNQNEVEWADIKDAETFTISEDLASFNYSLDDLLPGSYEIKAIAFDKFKHQSEEIVKDFRINAAPKDLQFSLSKDTYELGETVSITGGQVYDSDGIDDLVKIDFFLKKDNNDWPDIADDTASFTAGSGNTNLANFSQNLTITKAGNYQIKGVVYDKAGDVSNVVIHNLTVRSETVEPPVPNSPPEQLGFNLLPSYTIDQPVSINDAKVYDKDSESNLKNVKLTLYKDNDNVPQEITVNIVDDSKGGDGWGTFNYSWSNLGEGNYRLEAKAFDKFNGVSNQISRSFSVVGKPPVSGTNSPPEKLQLNLLPSYQFDQTVSFANAKVYDENGESDLDKVTLELYKDNKNLGNYTVGIVDNGIIGDKWGSFNISFDRLEPGNYQVKAIAFDKSGATNTDTANFTINLPVNKPPEDLRFNTLPLYTNAETISFDGARVSDPDGVGDLTKVDFWLQHPDGRWVDITDVTSEQFTTDSKGRARFGYNYDLSGLAPGRYQLRAIAQDKAGNFSIPETQTFSVITDPGGTGLSDEVRLAMVEAANLETYDPQALTQTREWVVWVTPGKSSTELANLLGAENLGATGQIPNTYIWKFPDRITPQDVANELGKLNGVEFAYPQVPVEIKLLHQPQDVLFPYQWNLAKTNVPTAWDTISPVTSQLVRGRNVVIGVVDDGIAYNHPDLKARYNAALSWDFSDNDSNPVPSSNKLFDQDIAPPKVDPLTIKFEKLVNLTGMVTDVNVTLNISKSLSPDLPKPTDLAVFLYSPDESAFDPGNWGNSLSIPRFPGREDLKFKQKVQLLIREDGSVEFDKNKLNGCYAGGIWKLEIENPDVNKYDQAKLQRLSQELLNSWLLQIQTLNPHGTAVAGIAGASENGKGIVGVAPEAQLAGLRLIGNIDQFTGTYKSDGLSIADALFQVIPRPNQPNRNQYIDVFNNSWGPQYMNRQPDALYAMEKGVNFGRNGLGNSYVFAAGNDGYWGGNINYNYFANSRQAIAVAAVDNTGIHSPYSTSGASVLVSAPSDNDKKSSFVGIYTTSISTKNWYANDFGGTSAAAPLVSGAVALMLEANPNLTARDVRHILVKTAQLTDVIKDAQGNIQAGNGWTKNQAGYWFNDKYGFGVIDVAKAVSTAGNWTPVATEDRIQSAVQGVNDDIPNGVGALEPSVIKVDRDITIESVEVLLDTDHQNWADLKVVLTSPDGTQSVLAEPISGDVLPIQPQENGFKVNNWKFTSVHHWGESSKGEWKLEVFDKKGNQFEGEWNSWRLNIYGTKPTVTVSATDANASEGGEPGEFTITRTGNLKNDLIINYSLGGNAINGLDYSAPAPSGTIIIPAVQSKVKLPITPIDDAISEGNESVVINLIDSNAYTVGLQGSDRVAIADNETQPKLFTDIDANLAGASASAVDWGDYDNDGDLDILITGYSPNASSVPKIYRNDNGSFVNIGADLGNGRYYAPAKWGDYDNDGDLDILLTGYGSSSKIYRNDKGSFIDIGANLPQESSAGSVDWGDYDNDGDLDILLTGSATGFLGTPHSKIYRNDKGMFIDIGAALQGVYESSALWGDYDNDGDLDILLAGTTTSGNTSKVYRNDNGNFIDIGAALQGVSRSSVDWGDYDNDGDLDILLTGAYISKVYRNNDGNFIDIGAGLQGLSFGSATWGDYDNDGDLDILMTGVWSSTGKLYRNDNGIFINVAINISDATTSSLGWGDYDNDGDLDILLAGRESFTGNSIARIYRNNSTSFNTPPTAPTNLNALVNGTSVTFNWNPATDAQTPQNGLTYNLRVGTTPGGSDIMSPMASVNGTRKVVQMGNANQNTDWTLKSLKPGKYYWSVQAIDSAFDGSAFATEGTFVVEKLKPSLEWVRQFGTSSTDNSMGIAVDNSGNVYTTGWTQGVLEGSNAGGKDAWVTKHDSNGNLLWTKQLGTVDNDSSQDVAVDNFGNIYISGSNNSSIQDAWVAKYDSNGNQQWIRHLSELPEVVTPWIASDGVSVDPSGNVYIGGTFGIQQDAWVAKYDSSGNRLWLKAVAFGNFNNEISWGVATDNSGNVYSTGWIDTSSSGTSAVGGIWIAKHDTNGKQLWTKQMSSGTDDRATNVAVDSSGNAYVTGFTKGNLAGTNAGGWDAWLAKYDNNGNLLWKQQFGSYDHDRAWDVTVDNAGSVYITGDLTFIEGANQGEQDAWIAKYDSNGNLLWTQKLASSNRDNFNGIAVDKFGNIYASGYTKGDLGGTNAGGDGDVWVAKFS